MSMSVNSSCCLLFTKAAKPGRVKTRLIGALTAEQTADLHRAFVDDVVNSLRRGPFELQVAWGSEDGATDDLPTSMEGLQVIPQHPGDLGQRLYHGLRDVSRRYDTVAAVGSDHPEITAAVMEDAFTKLDDGADVVLGPADDGGYFLIALRRRALIPELFTDISWSTETVCAETLARCRQQGLRSELLDIGHDIDVEADLAALVQRLLDGGAECPRTRQLLQRWDYLP